MSEKAKQFEFKEGEFVVTGWAEGQMEVEREDDRGNKVTVMQPYFQLFVLSPCSSFKSENYSASGLKAEKRKCSTNTFRYSTLHPVLAWLAQRQNSFQTWLGNKLDFSGVTSRLDAILAQLQTSGGSASCDHTYTQEMEQEATCGLPGLMVSTCSKCGNCYSEIVGALDHDWILSEHVEDVKDPATDEVTQAAYDIYTCSRCGQTYEDHTGAGAPADYGETSIAKIIVKLFAKLGILAGKIIGWIVDLFTKTLGGINDLFTRFTELTAQIISFGGDYPAWLTGFWGVLSPDLQLALSFAFLCTFVGIIGKKLFFS